MNDLLNSPTCTLTAGRLPRERRLLEQKEAAKLRGKSHFIVVVSNSPVKEAALRVADLINQQTLASGHIDEHRQARWWSG